MKNYHWISGNRGGNIRAKSMENAVVAAIKAQTPHKLDSFDKKKLYFGSFKVCMGKLPKYR